MLMELKHLHKMKPQQIAKKLRVSVQDVYLADQRLKVNLKKAMEVGRESGSNEPEYFYRHRVPVEHDNKVKLKVA